MSCKQSSQTAISGDISVTSCDTLSLFLIKKLLKFSGSDRITSYNVCYTKLLRQSEISSVSEISIEVGGLSGVVEEALEFAMDEAVKNTVLKDAKRTIIRIPGKLKCLACFHEFEVEDRNNFV